jgi:hypothetical protein
MKILIGQTEIKYVQLGESAEIVREKSTPFAGGVKSRFAERDGVRVWALESGLCKVTSPRGDYTCEGEDELDATAAAILNAIA